MRSLYLLNIALLMAYGSWLAGLESMPKPGSTGEKLAAASNPKETFSVYVPPGYSSKRPCPVLVVFSPGGGGRKAISVYKEAAANAGWLILASDSSRNNRDPKPTFKALNDELAEHLHVDPQRVYVAGMSGGSRVALMYAKQRPEGVAGLLQAAGAQVNEIRHEQLPNKDLAFIQFVGSRDYNYAEILRYAFEAKKAQRQVRTYVYPGGHGWPPKELAAAAIHWCEILHTREQISSAQQKKLLRQEVIFLESHAKVEGNDLIAHRWASNLAMLFPKDRSLAKFIKRMPYAEKDFAAWDAWLQAAYVANDNPKGYQQAVQALIKLTDENSLPIIQQRTEWLLGSLIERLTMYAKFSKKHRKDFEKVIRTIEGSLAMKNK